MIETLNGWDWLAVAEVVLLIHGATFFWSRLRNRQIRESQERKRNEASEET